MADHRDPAATPHVDVAGYVLGALEPAEHAAFEAHLATCAACRAEVAELGSLPSLLRDAAEPLPESLRARTFDAIAAAARRSGPGAVGGLGVTGPPGGPGQPGIAPPWSRHGGDSAATPPTGPLPPWSGHPGPPSHSGPQGARGPGSGVTPLRPRRRPVATVLVAVAAALAVVAAVAIGAVVVGRGDPDGTTIALSAGDVGSARGEAVVRAVEGGRSVELTVSGLPPTEPGSYYECWFVGPGDSAESPNRVSAGTFTVGADGTATVTLVSAADAERFPKLGVTLEPDDGDPARTGPKYLVSP